MLASGIRFWIIALSVLFLLVLTGHPTTTSYLYQTSGYLPSIVFRLLSLLLAFVLVISFHGIGLLFCPLIGVSVIPKHMEVPTRFFVGFLLASVAVYLIGFSGTLNNLILPIVILLGACTSLHKYRNISIKKP